MPVTPTASPRRLLLRALFAASLVWLGACSTPSLREVAPVIDNELSGTWVVRRAELGGRPFPLPPGFEIQIAGNQYRAGIPPYNDRGILVLFGDELRDEARRMDVVGEEGPNKGKRYPAIYRYSGRDLEVVYDIAEKNRPADFVSREGTQVLRVVYARK